MPDSSSTQPLVQGTTMEIRLAPRPDGPAQARFIATLGMLPGVSELRLSNSVDGVLSIRVRVRSGSDLLATLLAMDPPLLDGLTITDDGDLIARLIPLAGEGDETAAPTPPTEPAATPAATSRVAATVPLRRTPPPPPIAPTVELPRERPVAVPGGTGAANEASVSNGAPAEERAVPPTLILARRSPEPVEEAAEASDIPTVGGEMAPTETAQGGEHDAATEATATGLMQDAAAAGTVQATHAEPTADSTGAIEDSAAAGESSVGTVGADQATVAQTAVVNGIVTEPLGEAVEAEGDADPLTQSVVGMAAVTPVPAPVADGASQSLPQATKSMLPPPTGTMPEPLPFTELGPPRRERGRRRLLLVAGAVCALGLATAAALWWQDRGGNGGDSGGGPVAVAGEPPRPGVVMAGMAVSAAEASTATATAATATPTRTVSPSPTATPTATASSTPSPTPSPTPTPEPTPTVEPTPVPPPEPTPVPPAPPTPAPPPPAAPTARPAPPPTPTPQVFLVHTVQPGETVSSISALYGVPVADIIRVNRLPANGALVAGTEVYLPWR